MTPFCLDAHITWSSSVGKLRERLLGALGKVFEVAQAFFLNGSAPVGTGRSEARQALPMPRLVGFTVAPKVLHCNCSHVCFLHGLYTLWGWRWLFLVPTNSSSPTRTWCSVNAKCISVECMNTDFLNYSWVNWIGLLTISLSSSSLYLKNEDNNTYFMAGGIETIN